MLTLDLTALERQRTLRVEASIPESDALWTGTGLRPASQLDVRLDASATVSGEYVVRGSLSGAVGHECRRCLKDVRVPVDVDVTLVFVPSDALAEDDGGEARPMDASATVLELDEPIREELILAIAPYAVCSPECKGLCPKCGADRNVETCTCATEEADPRWDALRALQTD